MKKITFDKTTAVRTLPNWTGYLVCHDAHPGREFVLCRGTARGTGSASADWFLYDRASGIQVPVMASNTRKLMATRAAAWLRMRTPEDVVKAIEDTQVKYATRVLSET